MTLSYTTAPDYAALPAALLPLAKQQMNILFDDDDAFITSKIKSAIAFFELKSGLSVFPAAVSWTPPSGVPQVSVPVQPISSTWTVVDAGGADVRAAYQIITSGGVGGVSQAYFSALDGTALPGGLVVGLTVGVADPAAMPPSIEDLVLRMTAHLYENRELSTDLNLDDVPWWRDDLMVGHWIPRV